MPNWCNTTIKIYNENHEKLESLKSKIQEWAAKPFVEDAGKDWLGNIVGHSGIATYQKTKRNYICFFTNDGKGLNCRGYLIECKLKDGCLQITTDTAWGALLKLWKLLCNKYLGEGTKILYKASEPAMGIYDTNFPNLKGKKKWNFQEIDKCIIYEDMIVEKVLLRED